MTVQDPAAWHDDGSYNAIDDRRAVGMLIGNKGVKTSNDLAVTAAGAGLQVNIAAGHVAVDDAVNTLGDYYIGVNDASISLTPSAADATNERHDLVVGKIHSTTEAFTVEVVEGTPAGSPSDPTAPTNSVKLARLNITAGLGTITDNDIDDLRYWCRPEPCDLAYAEITSSESATNYASERTITNLQVTFYTPGSRRVRVSAQADVSIATNPGGISMRVKESSTQLAESTVYLGQTAYAETITVDAVEVPAEGSHTYDVAFIRPDSVANDRTVTAFSTNPVFVHVQLL
jgi:hypothetical protein|tara:strand:+ start:3660 stop:4523 length:864 start_codon:yes stop_codon:yes gene_type:complete